MGLAWWDYWLPAALSLSGRRVVTLERPTVAHLIHKEPQLDDSWRELAMRFATFVVRGAAKHQGPLPAGIATVLPLCRALSEMPEQRWRNRGADAEIGQMAVHFVPAITSNVISVAAPLDPSAAASPEAMSPPSAFRRFDERLAPEKHWSGANGSRAKGGLQTQAAASNTRSTARRKTSMCSRHSTNFAYGAVMLRARSIS